MKKEIYCFERDALLMKGHVIPLGNHEFDENTYLCICYDKHMNEHHNGVIPALCDEVKTYERLDYSELTWNQLETVVMKGKTY